MKLYDFIVESANSALPFQNNSTGSMPAGHNGLYHDLETPVRNTSHWLITFLKAYSISHDQRFLRAAEFSAQYLCKSEVRPMGATFWHRQNPEKDACNGLIGQAWTIEALAIAAQKLEMPELLDLAQEVFLLHPFNEEAGLWQRVGVDGSYLSFDLTFNHQLWFAAAGSLIAKYGSSEIDRQVQCFISKIPNLFNTYASGLIYHLIIPKPVGFRQKLVNLIEEQKSIQKRKMLAYKAIGYHSFNLYAFALLKNQYPSQEIWRSKKIKKSLLYAKSSQYFRDVQNNKYGYPYNPAGFEIPFSLHAFNVCDRSEQEKWISSQFNICFDFSENMMSKNTDDPNTHSARIYEATRLSNMEVVR
ncbi:hypothetical protein C1752_04445 [Acaryochloris thomasi RCC1774]|uniref:Uncharacterized protein n=1 Tax=Acaryochloris thomasi RCC1774 TaxID=1764569 RepID=A0A2W1JNP0_9CYAN|nr:agl cluster protein AglQ [Acaryochloris thomasi]PZD71764.1 hypothetical protein C1752_04445 [Acaryochloris thomasi RCC1774]